MAVIWINSFNSPTLDFVFASVTNLGNGIIFIPIFIATLFIRFEYSVLCVLASASHGLLIFIFKKVIFAGLPRPIGYLDNHTLHFVPGVEVHSLNSFPSGHTATIFCAALLLSLILRNVRVSGICLIVALLVAYSRIYLLQHFLIDVAAGAVLGIGTTFILWHVFSTMRKPAWMYKRLHMGIVQSPGDSVAT